MTPTCVPRSCTVASGLRINPAKCSALTIRCSEGQVGLIRDGLGFKVEAFPIKYLGLPLMIRKAAAAQFQEIIDVITNKLPTWHASTMDKARG